MNIARYVMNAEGRKCRPEIGFALMEKGRRTMKVTQSWKRNEPDTMSGESITLVTVYSSYDKAEIDDLEQKMPKGIMLYETAERRKEE